MKGAIRLVKDDAALSADAAAIVRVTEGDLGAFGEVFDRHAAALLAFVVRIAPARDAEDIVQSTFLRAVSLAAAFDRRVDSARPWLFGIASRMVLERRRAFARLARMLDVLRTGPPPVTRIETESSDLTRALERLATAKRVVVILVEVEGYTCEEVAIMLDVPIGTVWTRLHHARKSLRAYLEEES